MLRDACGIEELGLRLGRDRALTAFPSPRWREKADKPGDFMVRHALARQIPTPNVCRSVQDGWAE